MLKKIAILCLVLLSTAAFEVSAYADGKYDILYELSILDESYGDDGNITRGETAAIALKLTGHILSEKECMFLDVTDDNPFKDYIAEAAASGIMLGRSDLIFDPSSGVTYSEFKTVILRAAGYDRFNDASFFYYEGGNIIDKANIYGLRSSDTVTIEAAEEILIAALELPCYDLTAQSGIQKSDEVLMNRIFDVYRDEGTITAAGETVTGGRSAPGTGKIIISGSGGIDNIYLSGDIDYSELLGSSVRYYYRADEYENTLISVIVNTSKTNIKEVLFDSVTDVSTDLRSVEYIENGAAKIIRISQYADFIYNGRNCYEITEDDIMSDNGKISFTDSDNDSFYDVVMIEHYEYIIAAKVNLDNSTVLDSLTWSSIKLDTEQDIPKVEIVKNGKRIKLAYVSEGDVIAVGRSRDGEFIKAVVSDIRLNGTVSAFSEDDFSMTIAEETVKTIKSFDFSQIHTGVKAMVGLDHYGYAVGLVSEYSEPEQLYGYAAKIFNDENEDKAYAKIVTLNNITQTIAFADMFTINDIRGDYDELYSKMQRNGAFKPQLISYRINASGEISAVYVPTGEMPEPEADMSQPLTLNKIFEGDVVCVYNGFGMTVNYKYNMTSDGTVIDVPLNTDGSVDEKNIRIKNISDRPIAASSKPSYLAIYNSDNMYTADICVYEHKSETNSVYDEQHLTQAFVLDRIVEVYDEDEGEVRPELVGMYNGAAASFTAAEGVDISKLRSGDVLTLWTYDGVIQKYRRIFSIDGERYTEGYNDSVAIFENSEYTEDRPAQYIIEAVELGSSAQAAQSRWSNSYGSACLIYRSPEYPSAVVKLKIAGSNSISVFPTDSNTKAYIYHSVSKTTDAVSLDSLEFEYDRAVLTTRYGNVRDVIIYE